MQTENDPIIGNESGLAKQTIVEDP